MKPIIELFWQICLLRQSPAYVPTQGAFVAAVISANVIGSLLVSQGFETEVSALESLNGILVGQTVTALLVLLTLALRDLAGRFVATITALFGCELIITACFALVLPIVTMLGQTATSLVFLMFLIWSVAVAGFIMHRALGVQLAIGIGVAMAISLFSVTLSQLVISA
ncbi:MAG: hypothetical protein ACODAC_09780 [Pseudomonadota bacterium]